MTHTPGPWTYHVGEDGEEFSLKGANGDAIIAGCGCCGSPRLGPYRDDEGRKANGRLIAAAPELLQMARDFYSTILYYIKVDEKNGDDEGVRLKTVTANIVGDLIAKAEGRT
jgi:hypothetical protein